MTGAFYIRFLFAYGYFVAHAPLACKRDYFSGDSTDSRFVLIRALCGETFCASIQVAVQACASRRKSLKFLAQKKFGRSIPSPLFRIKLRPKKSENDSIY